VANAKELRGLIKGNFSLGFFLKSIILQLVLDQTAYELLGAVL